MRYLPLTFAAFLMQLMSSSVVLAKVKVAAKINLSSQTMSIRIHGKRRYTWPISSGIGSFKTPRGSFRPTFMKEMHYSKKYNNAPMPYSVFFNGGIAVHGTGAVYKLGRPASHGCVRLSVRNARTFYDFVDRYGIKYTNIKVSGRTPVSKKHRKKTRRRNRTHHNHQEYYNNPYYDDPYQGQTYYYDYY